MPRLMPTGECWCGCGTQTKAGSFFAPGHDKRAEAHVTKTVYGSVASYLDAHGYGPNGKNAKKEAEMAMDQHLRYFIQLTIRKDDPVNPAHVAQAISPAGLKWGYGGFGQA